MSNPIKDLFGRLRNRFGAQNTQPSLEDIFGSLSGLGGVIEIDGSGDIDNILAGILGAGRNGSGLREILASLVGISPEDIDETDPCPGCNEVHPGSGLSAAARRLRETGSAKKTETAGRQDGSEIWRRDLAAAQAIGMFMEEPDMAAATVNAFGELLYEQAGGDKEKLIELLGKLKTETIALDESGATAARTAKRISNSLAAASEDYERRLGEKDEEITRLKDELRRLRSTIDEAKTDAGSSSRKWYTKEEVVVGLGGVAVQEYPGRCGSYYFPQNSSGDPVDFSQRIETAQAQLANSRRGSLSRDEVNKLFNDLKTGRPFCGIYVARDGFTDSEIVARRLEEMVSATADRDDLLPLGITLRDIKGSTRPATEILEANFPKPAEVVEILEERSVSAEAGA